LKSMFVNEVNSQALLDEANYLETAVASYAEQMTEIRQRALNDYQKIFGTIDFKPMRNNCDYQDSN